MTEIVAFGTSESLTDDYGDKTDEDRRAYALRVALDRAKEVGNSNRALELNFLLIDAERIATWLRDGETNAA
jgi:hypothetical protein